MTITAVFWAVWYLVAGSIPDVSIVGNGWNLSFARLWDIPAAGLIAAWLVISWSCQNHRKYFLDAISKFSIVFMILCTFLGLLATGSLAVGFASGVMMIIITTVIASVAIFIAMVLASDIVYKVVSSLAVPLVKVFQSKPIRNTWAWLTGNR